MLSLLILVLMHLKSSLKKASSLWLLLKSRMLSLWPKMLWLLSKLSTTLLKKKNRVHKFQAVKESLITLLSKMEWLSRILTLVPRLKVAMRKKGRVRQQLKREVKMKASLIVLKLSTDLRTVKSMLPMVKHSETLFLSCWLEVALIDRLSCALFY